MAAPCVASAPEPIAIERSPDAVLALPNATEASPDAVLPTPIALVDLLLAVF